MKVQIVEDEWHPVYSLEEADFSKYEVNAEIGEKELAWMQSVFEQFDQVQERLRELYKEAS